MVRVRWVSGGIIRVSVDHKVLQKGASAALLPGVEVEERQAPPLISAGFRFRGRQGVVEQVVDKVWKVSPFLLSFLGIYVHSVQNYLPGLYHLQKLLQAPGLRVHMKTP